MKDAVEGSHKTLADIQWLLLANYSSLACLVTENVRLGASLRANYLQETARIIKNVCGTVDQAYRNHDDLQGSPRGLCGITWFPDVPVITIRSTIMATPFFGQTFTFTQPDSSTLRVRGWGDQHYAVFETLDGYTVTKNPRTRFWEVAQLSPDRMHLEPMPNARSRADGGRRNVTPGLRVDAAAARAAGREGALRLGGRRCDQRRR